MKKETGVTLVSLIVYIVGMVVLVAVVGSLLAFYNKNMFSINNSSDISMEFSKFNSKLIDETNIPGNSITEITTNKITFSSGNIYEFNGDKVYCNSVIISNYVEEFQANMEEEEDKQILNIYIQNKRGASTLAHNQSYVITLNPDNSKNVLNKILKIAPEVYADGLAMQNTLIKPYKNSNVQIVIPKGFAPAILNGSNWTTSEPGQDGSVKEIMKPEDWNKISINDINKGIVIVDHEITYDGGHETGSVPDFNEYVWVPIPTANDFARTAFKGETLTGIETADAYWEVTTTDEYQAMVASVNTNKGFYISRYEASTGANNVAQSKRGQTVWVGIAQNDSTKTTDAIRASVANAMSNTHLIYAIEWNSVFAWFIGHAVIETSTPGQTKVMELSDVTDSRSWGNHKNSTGNAANDSGSKRETGYSEYWKANNIYDLSGNVWEWSQEKYSNEGKIAIYSGFYKNDGDTISGSKRWREDPTYSINTINGFRYSFFI